MTTIWEGDYTGHYTRAHRVPQRLQYPWRARPARLTHVPYIHGPIPTPRIDLCAVRAPARAHAPGWCPFAHPQPADAISWSVHARVPEYNLPIDARRHQYVR